MDRYNYLFITNNPEVASYVESAGVDRIFVDLEIEGKVERQGDLDTVISRHSRKDISLIHKVLTKAEILVRINPYSERSKEEIDAVIEAGADIIMLPMFRTKSEIEQVGRIIDGRAKLMPLVETVAAANIIAEVDQLSCVDELHIGLNDLHLELKRRFMFELIADGYVESLISQVIKPCGIGGIARVGKGHIPGELIMSEHVRLGSHGVILSRAFHLGASSVKELNSEFDFGYELKKLKKTRKSLLNASAAILNANKIIFQESVKKIVS